MTKRIRFLSIPLSCLLGIALWYLLSFSVGQLLIPTPRAVAHAFTLMWQTGELIADVLASLRRVVVGFISGSFVAVVLGLVLVRVAPLRLLLHPIVEFLRFLSPTAMIPIAVIWFGIGEGSKYFLVFWGTAFIVIVSTMAGAARTPIIRQNALRCLGASETQIFRLVVLPSSIPSIVVGMRVALASAFFSIIPAELIAAEDGLGYLLQSSSILMQTDRIFVALVAISLVGMASDYLFQLVLNKVGRRFLLVTH